jgi:hypothetical protein
MKLDQTTHNDKPIKVKYIWCDDAGENKKLEKLCIGKLLGITFEYTGPGSPQYNGRVERKYATLYSRVRSMLNAAGLPTHLREGIWSEVAKTATDIENVVVNTTKPIAAVTKLYNTKVTSFNFPHPFGDIAIVDNDAKRKIRSKLEDRDRACLFLGITENHSNEVFRFLNMATNKVILSWDVIWLNKSYGKWRGITQTRIVESDPIKGISSDESDDESQGHKQGNHNQTEVQDLEQTTPVEINEINDQEQPIEVEYNNKQIRALRQLEGFFNPEAEQILEWVRDKEHGGAHDVGSPRLLAHDESLIDRKYIEVGLSMKEDPVTQDYDKISPTKY